MSKTSNINRVDGFAKVTGSATYSAEYKTDGVVYACLVGSTIAKGRIKSIDTKKAEWAPGVLAVTSATLDTTAAGSGNGTKTLGAGLVRHGPWGNTIGYIMDAGGTQTTGVTYSITITSK